MFSLNYFWSNITVIDLLQAGSILLMSQIVSYTAGPLINVIKPGTNETISVSEWSEQVSNC